MGLLKLGDLKKSKVRTSKTGLGQKFEDRKLSKDTESFGVKTGKGISLPKGNPPINK